MRESAIEAACCAYARKRGVVPIKLQGGVVGDPDRLFLLPHAMCLLVEFKSPAGRLTARQRIRHAELAKAGHRVSVVRATADFKHLLDVFLQAVVD
jgi:hypothetical protein